MEGNNQSLTPVTGNQYSGDLSVMSYEARHTALQDSLQNTGVDPELKFASVEDLKTKAPRVFDAFLQAFAFTTCTRLQAAHERSMQRIKEQRRV